MAAWVSPEKTPWMLAGALPRNVMWVRPIQPENVPPPAMLSAMLVTLEGMVMLVSPVQL